ncbi:DUF3304 domain-containing protein [Pseudomonas huaxiensis]|uniref:DUF3304 domain-containing protein n=1 Tax=Pseudomonas huaxiensis TaxID=2213017 RepID=UPI000DA6BB05|nr:DUF3304 domain-containing protein [Pseudomonas huaxiensis]
MLCGLLCMPMGRSAEAGILEGVNHTHWAINRFSVDGRSGMDTIGPWQGGGGGHYSITGKWQAGMTVQVDWETGVAGTKGFPGFGDDQKYEAWASKLRAQKRQLSREVPVPDYTGQSTCGLTVHFLPCDEIQLTTSCHRYGSPEYPIKTPLKLPKPQSCPVTGDSSTGDAS